MGARICGQVNLAVNGETLILEDGKLKIWISKCHMESNFT